MLELSFQTKALSVLAPPLQWQAWLSEKADAWTSSSLMEAAPMSVTPAIHAVVGSSFVQGLQAPEVHADSKTTVQALSLEAAAFTLCSVLVIIIGFEMVHLWYFMGEWSDEAVAQRSGNASADWNFSANLKIAYSYFRTDGVVRGRLLLFFIVLMGTLGVAMSYVSNVLMGRYWDALSNKQYDAFMLAVTSFCICACISIMLETYNPYMKSMLNIHWRESISRQYWTKWLTNSAHYRGRLAGAAVENPDQRIQQDAHEYCSITAMLFFSSIQHMLSMAVFLPLLWTLSPPGPWPGVVWHGWLAQFALVYALFGTIMMDLLGRRLIDYQYGQERSEADFRSRMAVIRDESEQVAMMRAEEAEQEQLGSLFGYVKSLFWQISFLKKRLDVCTGTFFVLGDILPLMMLAPAYFNGQMSLGAMLQCRSALRHVQDCFAWGIESYNSIAEWQCCAARLSEIDTLAEVTAGLPPAPEKGAFPGKIAAKHLGFRRPPPGDELLLDGAEFDSSNQWTLITGAEGAGKTTLLRSLKGLWPVEPNSEVQCSDALFMPVSGKCSALRRGTLHEAVAYPDPAEAYTREQVKQALEAVKLEGFEPEDYAASWGARLSSGQFQRLQLAHVICSQPELLVLDEPTSHTAPGEANALLSAVRENVPGLKGVLTVSHQVDELKPLHATTLTLDPVTKTLGGPTAVAA